MRRGAAVRPTGPPVSKKAGPVVRTLIVQPEDAVLPVLGLITMATRALDVKQFTLDEPRLVQALIDAHRRGVAVRVMLNPHRSSGDRANDATFAMLEQAGVPVQWSNPAFAVTHEKSLVVDGARALIATFNFVEKYFTQTRDYGVVTTDPAQVAQVARGFEADWTRSPFAPDEHTGLLWSTSNSRRLMARFIDVARKSLWVQHPKFVDATVVARLAEAHHRGVHVKILCGGKHGISDTDIPDTFSSLRILDRFGVKVHRQKHLKLHAKLLIADGERALLGSMNIDRSAFDLRRELGIIVDDEALVARLIDVYDRDWDRSHRWEVPDPLRGGGASRRRRAAPRSDTSSMTEPEPRAAAPGAPRPAHPVSLWALALAFLKIAMASLGGGLSAWALRVIVEERRWLTEQEFLAAFTICRIVPGPNQVNMAVYVGTHFRGLPGRRGGARWPDAGAAGPGPGTGRALLRQSPHAGGPLHHDGSRRRRRGHDAVGRREARSRIHAPARGPRPRGRCVRRRRLPAVALAPGARSARPRRHRLVPAASGGTEWSPAGMSGGVLLALVAVFGSASLVSFGGGNIILPELYRQAVSIHGWLTAGQFASVYAIAQAAPGPSTALLAGLIGLEAGGWGGALVAAGAMLLPGAAVMYATTLGWEHFRDSPWRAAVEKGLAPISMGLLLAAGVIIVRAADHGWSAMLVTAATTAALVWTRVNPLLIMAAAGLLGWLGLIR